MALPALTDNDKQFVKVPFQVKFGSEFDTCTQALSALISTYDDATDKNTLGESEIQDAVEVDPLLGGAYFQDTTCGGNDAINCQWQWNRDDDIVPKLLRSIPGAKDGGMGRVYASTTQHDQQLAWFTFGTPKFTGIAHFYEYAFNKDIATVNETGFLNDNNKSLTLSGIAYTAGQIGAVAFALPLVAVGWLAGTAAKLTDYPVSRYYDLRATMHLYYLTVDSILSEWLVNTHLYGNGDEAGSTNTEEADSAAQAEENALNETEKKEEIRTGNVEDNGSATISPDEGGENLSEDHFGTFNAKDYLKFAPFKGAMSNSQLPLVITQTGASIFDIIMRRLKIISSYQHNTENTKYYELTGAKKGEYAGAGFSLRKLKEIMKLSIDEYDYGDGTSAAKGAEGWSSFTTDWSEFLSAGYGGTQYVAFRVEKDVSADESFSNSTKESDIASQINGTIQSAADTAFNVGLKANGDGGGGAVAGIINGLFEGIKSVGSYVMNNLSDNFAALSTGASIDIPERYAGSDFSKSHSLKFSLRAPNGDNVSIYQSIIVPLAMLMAAAMPRAAGPNSYMSPFLLRAYCKGMFSIPMGIIESMSITRGSSEFGWSYDSLPTCVDVSLSIKDLSPAMYLSFKDSGITELLNGNTNFNEYMLTLSGIGLFERISRFAQIKRNSQLWLLKKRNRWLNPNAWSSRIGNKAIGRIISLVYPDTNIRSS